MKTTIRSGLSLKIIIISIALIAMAPAVKAETDDIIFEADKVKHNKKEGYVETWGHVRFAWQDYLLSADRARYYEASNIVEAWGHAALIEPRGAIIFAQKIRLTEDWKRSELTNLAVLFSDQSRMTARSAVRGESPFGQRKEMRAAVYSPCKVCQGEQNYPVWQIKAGRIVHHERSRTLYYNNIFLEIFGVPVFYLPLFSHPDPSVKRRTGFLTPAIRNSNVRGVEISMPFYINISPQISVELTPIITQKQGAVLQARWNHILTRGKYRINASIARSYDKHPEDWPDQNNMRGHFFSSGQFGIGDQAKWEYGIQLASDDDYLRFFNIAGSSSLTSHLAAEWKNDEHWLSIYNYSFNHLLDDDEDEPSAFVLPFIQYEAQPKKEFLGGALSFKSSLLSILRESEDEDVIRFSLEGVWQDHFNGLLGDVFHFYSSLRYDVYSRHCNSFSGSDCSQKKQTLTRILPLVMLDWRWPFFQQMQSAYQIIEPIVQWVYTPYRSARKKFPNEDSQTFSLSDSNIFAANRFSGLDQWEDGPRMNIGLNWTGYLYADDDDYSASFLLGQIFRLKDNPSFLETSRELHDKKSDIVSRLSLSFGAFGTLTQRVRLDQKFSPQRYEADLDAVYGPAGFFIGYAHNKLPEDKEEIEIYAGAAMRWGRYWRAYGDIRRDLGDLRRMNGASRSVRNRFGLLYDDECLKLDFSLQQNFSKGNGLTPDFVVGLRVSFKNLGDIKFSTGADFAGSTQFAN